ncbi:MAG TPA: dephospho-CoA kinase [Rhodocyclaceae bacterium]|nr:dephospho-CoA kinase [Rhodocyclaceae bacterium]HNB78130.1 dephospho-CoA kinase [Rhodocyclaceae bacterium]HNH12488.1 dephospho-CoA kinase [Rhodocyclaceae bacterium]HNH98712.1 dephospho-CoA kinase [Rhodocyclaceae bacterium]
MMPKRPLVVGLTGGIGSGKSLVAELFREHGVAIVDTDLIARELTGPGGAAMPAIRAAFGESVIDVRGALDRAAMRALAFGDPAQRERLEAILHPMIRRQSGEEVAAASAPYVMLVVPLLVESGTYRERVDRVLVVDCSERTQLGRVMARNALAADAVRAIMAAQATRAERLAAADDVIDNEGDFAALRRQVDELDRRYRGAV